MSICNNKKKIPIEVFLTWNKEIYNIYKNIKTPKSEKKISNQYTSIIASIDNRKPIYFESNIIDKQLGIVHPINCGKKMNINEKKLKNIWHILNTSSSQGLFLKGDIKTNTKNTTKTIESQNIFTFDKTYLLDLKKMMVYGFIIIRYNCSNNNNTHSLQNTCFNLDIEVIPFNSFKSPKSPNSPIPKSPNSPNNKKKNTQLCDDTNSKKCVLNYKNNTIIFN